jgi:hypothetical protein
VISRRFSVWQKVVALAPLLLVALYLPGEMMMRCRLDGRLRPACCCPQDKDDGPTGPVVQAQDCCERAVTPSVRPVVAAAPPADPSLIATVIALPPGPLVSADAPVAVSFDEAAQRYGPAREGPPLVLLKHAFLI